MITLAFPAPRLAALRASLWNEAVESAAVLLCVPVPLRLSGGWRLLVKEIHTPTDYDYDVRNDTRVQLTVNFCLPLERKARLNGWSVVYVHTHPLADDASFSSIDDASEEPMACYLALRCPGVPHGSLLFARSATAARKLGTKEPMRVLEIGATVRVASDQQEPVLLEDRFDRQVRAFGAEGQRRIAQLTVAIVGLGGTGSLVAQQLAHLGVRKFILVDDDVVEASNLNRVVAAQPTDVDETAKIEVAGRTICGMGATVVAGIRGDVTTGAIARQVVEADVIFNCTDTHASRHVLNQASYQYLAPMIDMGVSITVDASMAAQFSGHVKMVAPGLSCLWCIGNINPDAVRVELMTPEQRATDPYIQGAAVVIQPAVISLNGVVASVAVTMLLAAIAGVPAPARFIYYDGNRSRMNAIAKPPDDHCIFCGPNSTLGCGDMYPLPIRHG
jgi:molybdopterin/thiamine biosynthesis adenylyltransferase